MVIFLRGIAPRNLWSALGLLATGLIVTVLALFYIKASVESAAQCEFDFICNEIRLNISDRLAVSAQNLRSGAALFDASESVWLALFGGAIISLLLYRLALSLLNTRTKAQQIAEADYRAIFENTPVGIFQSTPHGRFRRVNPAMARIFGYDSPDEMMEEITNISSQIYVNASNRLEFQSSLMEHGKFWILLVKTIVKTKVLFGRRPMPGP
jgi:PAS domain-containing protein